MTRCFLRLKHPLEQIDSSKSLDSPGTTGQRHHQFAQYSEMRSSTRVYPTFILIAFGTRSSHSAWIPANLRNFKAWSQNLGHEKVLTTFVNYGEVACRRQGEIMRGLAEPRPVNQCGADEIADALLKKLRDSGGAWVSPRS